MQRMDGWMDRGMDGWMNDGWMDGWINVMNGCDKRMDGCN